MSEREKMQQQKLYDANYDEELKKERLYAKELCYDYNQLRPSQQEERRVIIQQLFGKTKKHFNIEPSFWCDYGYNIEIGEYFYSNHNLVILDEGKSLSATTCLLRLIAGLIPLGILLTRQDGMKGWSTRTLLR